MCTYKGQKTVVLPLSSPGCNLDRFSSASPLVLAPCGPCLWTVAQDDPSSVTIDSLWYCLFSFAPLEGRGERPCSCRGDDSAVRHSRRDASPSSPPIVFLPLSNTEGKEELLASAAGWEWYDRLWRKKGKPYRKEKRTKTKKEEEGNGSPHDSSRSPARTQAIPPTRSLVRLAFLVLPSRLLRYLVAVLWWWWCRHRG